MDPRFALGRDALRTGEWERARSIFEELVKEEETPEAFEELGWAASWLHDADTTVHARERAYRLFKDRGDRAGAARAACWLAVDLVEFRGEHAVATGWLGRAARLIEGLPPCSEHGLVMLLNGHIALMGDRDTREARSLASTATRLGRDIDDATIEMMGLALEGLALVSEGSVAEGMRLLDESTAAAVGGESDDLNAVGTACCYLIHACERVRDYDRAAQWCGRVKEFCRRWRLDSLFATCRTQYAALLIWRGEWAEADLELAAAERELRACRPPLVTASLVRRGELRRRQGEWKEAMQLFEQVPSHQMSLLGRGLMALESGDAATALDFAERFLRRVPRADRTERVPGLELLVRAYLALDRRDDAVEQLAELRETASMVPTDLLRASALHAEALIEHAGGGNVRARALFEDAIEIYDRIPTPYEAARARLELAGTLDALGSAAAANEERAYALKIYRTLGARRDIERLTGDRSDEVSIPVPEGNELTKREGEVLTLIAEGKSNEEIAAQLFLSIRTIERHVSNIYLKIGATGRHARAVATAYALRGAAS